MNRFNEAKNEYEAIEIPEELETCVRSGIVEGTHRAKRKHMKVRLFGTTAACLALMFAGLNTVPNFAAAAADIPVVGQLFRVMTVQSWETSNSDATYTVNQPAISGENEFTEKINAEIQKRVDEKVDEGNKLIEEYKDAFLSTGGTQEQWEKHNNKVSVTYDIKSQTDSTVSFVISSSVSFASAYQEQYFYNLNMEKETNISLFDLLGDNWIDTCNACIKDQMKNSEDPTLYFDENSGGFHSVDESTQFYINESGNPVIVYPRASIAVGALGTVEFEIAQ